MSRNRKSRRSESNRNSRVVTVRNTEAVYARSTYTARRDEGSLAALIDTESNNSTKFVITRNGATLQLNGHEARTLFTLLEKHFYG